MIACQTCTDGHMNKKELVREKIGRVAMKCFSKYGLEKTTLDDIAKEVGLNKASLYYYYKNKEDIFLEVAIREGQDFLADLMAKTLVKKNTEERVGFYLRERINYYKNILNMNRVSPETLHKMLPRFFELFDSIMKEEVQFLSKIIRDAVKNRELVKVNPDKLASSLIAMNDALKHHAEHKAILKNQDEIDYTEILLETKFLVSLIFKGLNQNSAEQ
ncbi:MAG TPA: TetR/AcrR family transcriptional regulator [Puia sp.]|nr:TetR/AcrR family transcriptional regulator [Puia sp.]